LCAKLIDQNIDIGCQPIFEPRVVRPMRDGTGAPLRMVFGNLHRPSRGAKKVVGRVDVALARELWDRRIEHEQIAVTLELVHLRSVSGPNVPSNIAARSGRGRAPEAIISSTWRRVRRRWLMDFLRTIGGHWYRGYGSVARANSAGGDQAG